MLLIIEAGSAAGIRRFRWLGGRGCFLLKTPNRFVEGKCQHISN